MVKNKKKLSRGQIFMLVGTVLIGLISVAFGVACIVFEHLMEGMAIVSSAIILVALLIVMICDGKTETKIHDFGDKLFTISGVNVLNYGQDDIEYDVTLTTGGIMIDSLFSIWPVWYDFDDISTFSINRPNTFVFALKADRNVTLSGIKKLHIKALREVFLSNGVKEDEDNS